MLGSVHRTCVCPEVPGLMLRAAHPSHEDAPLDDRALVGGHGERHRIGGHALRARGGTHAREVSGAPRIPKGGERRCEQRTGARSQNGHEYTYAHTQKHANQRARGMRGPMNKPS